MTSYTKRDIRAADLLAVTLVGSGVVLLLRAAAPLIAARSAEGGDTTSAPWIVAGGLVALGLAVNLKIKQLVRNAGREPTEYSGVPE